MSQDSYDSYRSTESTYSHWSTTSARTVDHHHQHHHHNHGCLALVTWSSRDELFFYGKMMNKTRDCHGATPSGHQMMGELGDYPTDNSSQISSPLELFKSRESKWNLFGTRSFKGWWVLDEQNLPRLEIRGFIWLWVKTLIPLVPKKSWLMDGYASKNGNHRFWPIPIWFYRFSQAGCFCWGNQRFWVPKCHLNRDVPTTSGHLERWSHPRLLQHLGSWFGCGQRFENFEEKPQEN